MQGGWGKRSGWDGDNEWPMNENDNESPLMQYDEYVSGPHDFEDFNDDEKRAWKSLTPTWGKRANDWESFRGKLSSLYFFAIDISTHCKTIVLVSFSFFFLPHCRNVAVIVEYLLKQIYLTLPSH